MQQEKSVSAVKLERGSGRGVQVHTLAQIVVGMVMSGCKKIYHNDSLFTAQQGDIFILCEGIHHIENCPPSKGKEFEQILFCLTAEQLHQNIVTLVNSKADPTLNVALLRYFNPVGAHESGLIGEDPTGIPNNLTPYIAQVAVGKREALHVYGDDYPTVDGTGVRDYIHVVDLAEGHVKAMEKLETGCGLFVCNLGTGKGTSVLEVVRAYEKACGKTIPYVVDPRRPGDLPEFYADPARAREELGWEAKRSIEEMCASSWNWQSKNPNGFRG